MSAHPTRAGGGAVIDCLEPRQLFAVHVTPVPGAVSPTAPVMFANRASMRVNRRGVLTVRGTGGDDIIRLAFQTGAVFFEGPPLNVTINGETKAAEAWWTRPTRFTKLVVRGLRGNDAVSLDANVNVPAELTGGAGADLLMGGPAADVISGGAGDDLLRGFGGADKLRGGGGKDGADQDATDLVAKAERFDVLSSGGE